MERWLEFMGNHPILFGILGVLIVLFFVMESRRSGRKISPQSLGSRNIPYSQLDAHLEELKTSDRPLIFICNLGQVAGTALQKVGHADSYRLDGGIMNWKGQGLPLVKTAEGKNSKSHK